MATFKKTLATLALTAGLLAGAAAPAAATEYFATTSGVTCSTNSSTCTFSFFVTNPPIFLQMNSFTITIAETSPWRFAAGGYTGPTLADPDQGPYPENWSPSYLDASLGGFRTIAFNTSGSLFEYGFTFDVQMTNADYAVEHLGYTYFGEESHGFIQGEVLATPEPMTLILLGSGLAGVAGAARRRRRNATGLNEDSLEQQRSTATNFAPRGTL